ncbi:hypothetical protein D3C71_1800830 [compost metagenome]
METGPMEEVTARISVSQLAARVAASAIVAVMDCVVFGLMTRMRMFCFFINANGDGSE